MTEEQSQKTAADTAPVSARATGGAAIYLAGGVLGLLVFVAGVALVLETYRQAAAWYREIGPAIDSARVGSSPQSSSGKTAGPGKTANSSTGVVAARPDGRPLSKVATEFGLRLVWLLVMAFLGFLLAVVGAKLTSASREPRYRT